MYQRLLKISKSNSFFLFGARGTGKSTLLREQFSEQEAVFIDLLDPDVCDQFISKPSLLMAFLSPHLGKKKWVVIDEVQRVPKLLDVVHKLIFEKKFLFALTGSSARKLKRGSANMLAGRAFLFNLYPLTINEIGDDFDLDGVITHGALPGCLLLSDKNEKERYLKAYIGTYIKEEILVEQLVRKLPPFRRFIEVAATCNAEIINYSNIARDVKSDASTIKSYYEILEDTLLGFKLPSYHRSLRKRQREAPKFYFFDTGITRALAGLGPDVLAPKTYEYGLYFESFIINEIHRQLEYLEKNARLSYLRVDGNLEIDLIIELGPKKVILCEIKSSESIHESAAKSLRLFSEDFPGSLKLVISKDSTEYKFGDIEALHWRSALKRIIEY